MRKKLLLTVSIFSVLTLLNNVAFAKELPVKRVVLSTSGMAHFEHQGQVNGDTKIELPVRLNQVDDLLKSLIIFDTQGTLGGVSLPGQQSLAQAFKDLPFGQNALNSPVYLLNAYQGAKVTAKMPSRNYQGQLVRVVPEKKYFEDGKQFVQRHRVSLLTAKGLQQVMLEDLTSITFDNPKINQEIEKALFSIRENSTHDIRTLEVSLKGKAKRDVAMTYVVEAPLWKASYRMVLPPVGKQDGFLQGWAILENMTSSDWKNVDLTLVSGNPVTFHQALYQSYHVSRPDLPVEVFGRVMPRVDHGTLGDVALYEREEEKVFAESDEDYANYPSKQDKVSRMKKARRIAASPQFAGMAGVMSDMPAASPIDNFRGRGAIAQTAQAAQSSDATTQVLFRFPHQYDLKSGQSMMLPFVNQDLAMERISLYQPETHATHPLAAVKIKNEGQTGLPPGILTLYEESASLGGSHFVGDAQMPVLAKGEERMISYALDSKTKISREIQSASEEVKVTISRGVMKTKYNYRQETIYKMKAPAEETRTIVLEQAKQYGYKIAAPQKGVEETDQHYRIKTTVAAGEAKKLKVTLIKDEWQSIAILGMNYNTYKAFAGKRGKLDRATRKAFAKMAQMRAEVDKVQQRVRVIEAERQNIYNDQNRLRENIRSLSGKSDLKNRYLDRLEEQEDRLEEIEKQTKSLNKEKKHLEEQLKNYIFSIKV